MIRLHVNGDSNGPSSLARSNASRAARHAQSATKGRTGSTALAAQRPSEEGRTVASNAPDATTPASSTRASAARAARPLQGPDIAIDKLRVTTSDSNGSFVTHLVTGQINEGCNPASVTLAGGDLNFGTSTIPIAADGSFTIDTPYQSKVDEDPSTGHLTMIGHLSAGTATGFLLGHCELYPRGHSVFVRVGLADVDGDSNRRKPRAHSTNADGHLLLPRAPFAAGALGSSRRDSH